MYLPLYIIHGPLLTLYWRAERPGRGGRGGLLRRSLSPQSNLVRPFSHFPTLWKNLSWERKMKLRQKAPKSENGRGRFSTFGTLVGVRLCLRRATRAHPARREIERHAHEIQSCEWVVGSGGLINSKASIIMRFVWGSHSKFGAKERFVRCGARMDTIHLLVQYFATMYSLSRFWIRNDRPCLKSRHRDNILWIAWPRWLPKIRKLNC